MDVTCHPYTHASRPTFRYKRKQLGNADRSEGQLGNADRSDGQLVNADRSDGQLENADRSNGQLGNADRSDGQPGNADRRKGRQGMLIGVMGKFVFLIDLHFAELHGSTTLSFFDMG